MDKPPVNIWSNIERCWVLRLDIVFEGQTITGIHHSDFINITQDIDRLCLKLQDYKKKMKSYYGDDEKMMIDVLKYTHIYLLYDPITRYTKIGRSKNPTHREKTLYAELPKSKIIWISGLTQFSTEMLLHKLYKSKRIRGEWFDLSSEDIINIKHFVDGKEK